MTRGLALVVLAVAAGCAPRTLVERAIAARGGSLPGLVRDSDVRVVMGFPGDWQWRTVWAPPERYAWTIVTNDLPHHYLFDGDVVRAYVGDGLAAEHGGADLRSHARFVAVANLDVLRLPGVQVGAVPDGPGTRLDVVFPDRGDRYVVDLDAELLVRRVEGAVDLSPFAQGVLAASYDDQRVVRGRRLPHRIRYAIGSASLADERVRRTCVLGTTPPASAFAAPGTLPACP